ncbi:hypothetical protein ACFL5Z_14630 [Planctomycetota bacterium]
MVRNFETVKKELKELAGVVNAFKSEAVQLRIVELVLGASEVNENQTPEKETASKSKRKKKKAKTKPSNLDARAKKMSLPNILS